MANRRFYFVRKNGQETGPYSVSQLAEQWKSGTITADDEIREDGGTGRWYPVRDFSKQLDRGRESEGQAYSGPARAAWILLFITCGISIVPVLGFAAWIVAAPILLAAFVLSLIVLSRGGTAEGLMLLLATIVGAPLVIAVAPVVSSMLAAAIASSSQHHTASLPSPTQPFAEVTATPKLRPTRPFAQATGTPKLGPTQSFAEVTASPKPGRQEVAGIIRLTRAVPIQIPGRGTSVLPVGLSLRYSAIENGYLRVHYADTTYWVPQDQTDFGQ